MCIYDPDGYLSDEFLKKRVEEQGDYVKKILASDLPDSRKAELVASAHEQLIYFVGYQFGKPLARKIDDIKISPIIFKDYEGKSKN